MAIDRLGDGNPLPHSRLVRVGEHLCRQLRLRQRQHLRFCRTLGQTAHVDRPFAPAGLHDTDGRFPGLRDLCLPLLRHRAPAAGGHDIPGPRYQGVALVAGAGPGEPATGRVCQVCHGACPGAVVRHLWLLSEKPARPDAGRPDNRLAHRLYHRPEGDGVGPRLRLAHLCPLPRGTVGAFPLLRAVCHCLFCGGGQVFESHVGGRGRRRGTGVYPHLPGGSRHVAALPEERTGCPLSHAGLLGHRGGVWCVALLRGSG